MLVLLSPAKRLVEGPAVDGLDHSTPALLERAERLAARMRAFDVAGLQDLMGVSEALAETNVARFRDFQTPFTPERERQAVRLFAGDTYVGLDAESLSTDDLAFAQTHLALLSGLYGVLRPLDLVHPYRLEMGTRVAAEGHDDLYAFWHDAVAEHLRARLAEAGPTVVCCASKEYARVVDRKALGDVRWIEPVFRDEKGGKARVISFFAKQARGAMARWVVQHRIREPEALEAFDGMGYRLVDRQAKGGVERWSFHREQPPPVNG